MLTIIQGDLLKYHLKESGLDNKPKESFKNSEDKISDISEAEKIKTKNV